MMDGLNHELGVQVCERVKAERWEVVAIAGGPAIPEAVQRWIREEFELANPVLVIVDRSAEKNGVR